MPYQSISLQISVTPHSRNLAPQNYNIFPSPTKNHQKKSKFLQFPQVLQFLRIVIFGIFVFVLSVLLDLLALSRASLISPAFY